MSWDNCKTCVITARPTYTSSLFKVLVTLKLLHGSRTGAKGSTLEDIAMHMIKFFCLDGDIKSQVLATLKYGVKMHFIQKKKEKFCLVLPASAIHLAPCKYKNEEMERIKCMLPSKWQSNACNDSSCGAQGGGSCCGKRKGLPNVCCQGEPQPEEDPCALCQRRKPKPTNVCTAKPRRQTCDPCMSQRSRSRSVCREPSQSCPEMSSSENENSCLECFPKKRKKAKCPKPKVPVCARKRRRGSCKSLNDDYCQMCGSDDDDGCNNQNYKFDAYKNCTCFPQ